MATLILQCMVAVLTVVFGVLALRVALGTRSASEFHGEAWLLTGCVFTILGVSSVIQLCIGAPWAYFSGAGTPAYETYLRLSPVGNHSRGFLVVAYGVMLANFLWFCRIARGRLVAVSIAASFVAMAIGGVYGWLEGPLVRATHWTSTAVSDSVELILLMAALLVGIVWNTTDRLLWIALVIFTVHELFDVTWYSALAWGGLPGAWRPSPMYIHLYASVAYVGMIAAAVRRLRLARRGVKVPGLLEPPAHAAHSLIG